MPHESAELVKVCDSGKRATQGELQGTRGICTLLLQGIGAKLLI